MNIEQNRLQTFNEWPNNAVVTPQRIAKAGFFATKQGTEVECFACHLKISTWNYGDQAMTRHRSLSPECPFVINPSTSGNVPIVTSTTVPVPSSSQLNYKDEQVRLSTFENWPSPNIVTPENLARAGFYFLKIEDTTKCAYCQGVVRAWESGDDPDNEHKRLFPSCPFVTSVITPRLNPNEYNRPQPSHDIHPRRVNIATDIDGNLDELGVQKHRGPKRSSFGTLESRLRTYISWPSDLIQTPDSLSQAGFYYEGTGDQVRCFHCDGGLRHWDPHDDPWTEHARWFPNCSFVKLVKGQEFVTAATVYTVENATEAAEINEKLQPPKTRREISERELQEHMSSPTVMAALNIGINMERVKRAVKMKLLQTGRSYSEPDALVEAALNLQLDEDDNFEMESPNSIRNHIRREIGFVLEDIAMQEQLPPSSNVVSNCINKTSTEVPPPEASNPVSREQSVSLEEENRLLKEARTCKICMDGEVGIVFLPCGHLATCVNCAPNLEDCPVCRSEIKATVRTFLS